MKNLKYFVIVLMAVSFISCKNNAIKVDSQKISGPLGKFYEVVEKDYQINNHQVSVEFKRIAEGGPVNASWSSEPTFTAELFDNSGNLITSASSSVVLTEDQLETVFSLGVDETSFITFKFEDNTKGATSMKISSKWDEPKETKEESNVTFVEEEIDATQDAVVANTSTPNNAKADALLDELENLIDRWSKTKNYEQQFKFLEQATELCDKIDDLDLSDAQEKRYYKIGEKMLEK